VSAPILAGVFAGGGAGALCRYWIGRFIGERYGGSFPVGTVAINVSGCFLLGLFATLVARHGGSGAATAVLMTGFLGGYTTFSTYALEAVVLYMDGARRLAAVSICAPILLGLLAASLGALLGQTAYGV
jgi:fluoride exporter